MTPSAEKYYGRTNKFVATNLDEQRFEVDWE